MGGKTRLKYVYLGSNHVDVSAESKLVTTTKCSSHYWPVHLVWMTARLQQDTFLSWHLAPASEVAGGHTLPF
jgi:hypothetical protein